MKLSIYNVEKKAIRGKGEITYWSGRDKNKTKHIIVAEGHEPYFYTSSKFTPDDDRIKRTEDVNNNGDKHYSYDNKELNKIIVTNSINVSGYGDNIGVRDYFEPNECYEDDIPYKQRVFIDSGAKNGIEVPDNKRKIKFENIQPVDFYIPERRIHLDIETRTSKGNKVPDPERAKFPVVLINCIDSYTKISTTFGFKKNLDTKGLLCITKDLILKTPKGTKYKWVVNIYKDEIDMFRGFLEYYKYVNTDFICAWNGQYFDIPYLINRMIEINNKIDRQHLGVKKLDYLSLSPFRSVYKNNYTHSYEIKGKILFDTQIAYLSRQTKTTSGRLTNAGKKILGYGKIDLGCSFNTAYLQKFKEFIYYNAIDTIICYEVYEKLRQQQFYSSIRRFIGVSYNNIFSNLRIIDHLFLVKAKEKGIVLPSARGAIKEGFGGGAVQVPTIYGRVRNVCTFDFKSLYPLIIKTFNIGFDTYIGHDLTKDELAALPYPYISTPINTYFRSDIISIVAECISEFIDYRDDIKEELLRLENKKGTDINKLTKQELINLDLEIVIIDDEQMVIKFLTNSIYGVFGTEHFRLYNVYIAASITGVGRKIIMDSRLVLIKFAWDVIYGDTDSVKVRLQSKTINNMIKESKKIEVILNRYFNRIYPNKFNLKNSYLFVRPETISSTYFMARIKGSKSVTAKKKYSECVVVKFVLQKTIILDKPEIIIKGYIKSNSSIVGNDAIKKVNYMIHEDKSDDEIKQNILGYLQDIRSSLTKFEYPMNNICLRVKASKPFSKYTRKDKYGNIVRSKVEHIDAGRWTNQWAYIWDGTSNLGMGSIINYLFVKPDQVPGKYAKTDKVALDENDNIAKELVNIIDFKRLYKKSIYSPLEPILKEIGIEYNNIISDYSVESLV